MSMLSAQVDELRAMAESVGLEVPQAATLMMDAADTIWELRCKLSGTVDERERMFRANVEKNCDLMRLMDENAKLRELVDGLRYCANESHGHGRCSVRLADGYVTYCPLYDVDSGTARCEALMRELGIEVE